MLEGILPFPEVENPEEKKKDLGPKQTFTLQQIGKFCPESRDYTYKERSSPNR